MPEDRRHERIRPRRTRTTLILPTGREVMATIIDVSRSGVALALASPVAPPVGTPVTVGATKGRVVRAVRQRAWRSNSRASSPIQRIQRRGRAVRARAGDLLKLQTTSLTRRQRRRARLCAPLPEAEAHVEQPVPSSSSPLHGRLDLARRGRQANAAESGTRLPRFSRRATSPRARSPQYAAASGCPGGARLSSARRRALPAVAAARSTPSRRSLVQALGVPAPVRDIAVGRRLQGGDRLLVQLPHHLGGRADDQRAVGKRLVLGHQRAGADEAMRRSWRR